MITAPHRGRFVNFQLTLIHPLCSGRCSMICTNTSFHVYISCLRVDLIADSQTLQSRFKSVTDEIMEDCLWLMRLHSHT